jgi:hypothetical protein
MSAPESFHAQIAKERKIVKDAARSFVEALRSTDSDLFYRSLGQLQYNVWDGWLQALRAAAKMTDVPAKSRTMMLALWVHDGDVLRDSVTNDLLLCDALRNILPPYQGGPVLLFRGESWSNHRRRTYGLSWTDDRVVAESFANNKRKFFYEGTTVLETLAPPEAIICVPRLCIDDLPHDVEAEYLVDRRRLRSVKMIAKYPPTSGIGLKAKGK